MNERIIKIIDDFYCRCDKHSCSIKKMKDICSTRLTIAKEFLLLEKNKGERVCKKTAFYLNKHKNSDVLLCYSKIIGKYSSGRKIGVFDEQLHVLRFNIDAGELETLSLCSQEIDDYAKSHRIILCKPFFLEFPSIFIQVFEHKVSSI